MVEYWNEVFSMATNPQLPPPPTSIFERFVDAADGFLQFFQNSIVMLFSSTWPYKRIDPLQAYILGVATPLLAFVIHVYCTRSTSDLVVSRTEKANRAIPNLSSGASIQISDEISCKQSRRKFNYASRPKLYPPLKRPQRRYYDRVYRENSQIRPFAKRAMSSKRTPRNRIVPKRHRRGSQFPNHESATCHEEVLTGTRLLHWGGTEENIKDPPELNRSTSDSHIWEPCHENPNVARLDNHSYDLYHHMNSATPRELVIDNNTVEEHNHMDALWPTQHAVDSSDKENRDNRSSYNSYQHGRYYNYCMKDTYATDLQANSSKTPFATSKQQELHQAKSSRFHAALSKSSRYIEYKNEKKIVPYDEFEQQSLGCDRNENNVLANHTIKTTSNAIKSEDKNQGKLVALISLGVFDRKQKEDQDAALKFLKEWKIPFELVDGMNSSQNDR